MPNNKTYLGDSVYVKDDVWALVLTTENDPLEGPSNTIYLEPEVASELMKYIERRNQRLREEEQENV